MSVELPEKKNIIPQCLRCQEYGHTRSYCNKAFACVKCGGGHITTIYTKDRSTPAKCTLCGGDHPANYKGCTVYQDFQKSRNAPFRGITNTPRIQQAPPNLNEFLSLRNQANNHNGETQRLTQNVVNNPQTWATRSNNPLTQDQQQLNTNEVLTNFLNEFKNKSE